MRVFLRIFYGCRIKKSIFVNRKIFKIGKIFRKSLNFLNFFFIFSLNFKKISKFSLYFLIFFFFFNFFYKIFRSNIYFQKSLLFTIDRGGVLPPPPLPTYAYKFFLKIQRMYLTQRHDHEPFSNTTSLLVRLLLS